MLWSVRTTITIDDELLHKAKIIAAKRGVSLKDIIEEGLREVILRDSQQSDDRRPLLFFPKTGGVMPGINLDKTSELLDKLDEWDAADRRRRSELRDI